MVQRVWVVDGDERRRAAICDVVRACGVEVREGDYASRRLPAAVDMAIVDLAGFEAGRDLAQLRRLLGTTPAVGLASDGAGADVLAAALSLGLLDIVPHEFAALGLPALLRRSSQAGIDVAELADANLAAPPALPFSVVCIALCSPGAARREEACVFWSVEGVLHAAQNAIGMRCEPENGFAYLGGGQWAVWMHGCTAAQAKRAADRHLDAVSAAVGAMGVKGVRVHAGIASATDIDQADGTALLAQAQWAAEEAMVAGDDVFTVTAGES